MKRALFVKVLGLASVLVTSAWAEPRPARDTADVGDRGSWSIGLFKPLRIAVHDRVELEAHPIYLFVAPHLNVRYAFVKPSKLDMLEPGAKRGARLTGEVGVQYPTLGMRLMSGFFFPTWSTSTNTIGHMLIPRVGIQLSGDVFTNDVITGVVDTAFRIPLGPNSAAPLNSMLAPLDIMLAAPLTGFSFRAGVAYDHAFGDRLRLRGEFNMYITGKQGNLIVDGQSVGPLALISPFIFTGHLALDIAVFKQSRISIGAWWGNMDSGARDVITRADGFSERVKVRSNNFLPTIDYIWAGW